MLNGNAQRPGDIVTALSGKTIEVLNTDAEGRLILADAITYANRNGATHMVDAATLTGAIGIALGHYNMGAFTNDEAFLASFLAAARVAGEKTWQLPMDEEYKEYLKSAVRRFAEYRRALWRVDYRRVVSARVRRSHALGPSRYRIHRVAR